MTSSQSQGERRPSAGLKRCEGLLDGFRPDFEFQPVNPLPETEFADRLRRLRREATVAGHDVTLVHADVIGWYHASNSYLRYMCDWAREGRAGDSDR